MQVVNEVTPTDPERMRQIMEPGPSKPIYMVNLLKFKDKADYKDGRACDLSGLREIKVTSAENNSTFY